MFKEISPTPPDPAPDLLGRCAKQGDQEAAPGVGVRLFKSGGECGSRISGLPAQGAAQSPVKSPRPGVRLPQEILAPPASRQPKPHRTPWHQLCDDRGFWEPTPRQAGQGRSWVWTRRYWASSSLSLPVSPFRKGSEWGVAQMGPAGGCRSPACWLPASSVTGPPSGEVGHWLPRPTPRPLQRRSWLSQAWRTVARTSWPSFSGCPEFTPKPSPSQRVKSTAAPPTASFSSAQVDSGDRRQARCSQALSLRILQHAHPPPPFPPQPVD